MVAPGSISQAQPLGQVLAENSAVISISQTLKIGGALAINPPLTQAGVATPVTLTAMVRNAGNVALAAGPYTLTVTDPATGSTLYTAQAQGTALDVGVSANIGFGTWSPTKAGNLPVTVRAQDSAITGSITGTLYVGDKANGAFTINSNTVPEGTQTVHGQIALQGVDVTRAVSTDPLYVLTQAALKRGGQYTAPAATSWYNTNRCLGCHIVSQSQFGLADAANKAEVDKGAVAFLANSILSSQHDTSDTGYNDGALYISNLAEKHTQTYLGTWALTAAANKADTFRSLYKASKFQIDTCNAGNYFCARSGNTSFWRNENASTPWWYNDMAATALVVSGFAEVLENATKLDLTAIHDYGLKAGVALHGNLSPYDIEAGPDGAFYVAKRGGQVQRLDPATGQVTEIASGLGDARGIAVMNDGTIYVSGVATSTTGFLRRINPNGTKVNVPLGTVGQLPDVELGPDGWLYVSDYNLNRILRVSPATGQYETFASGGLINAPGGLAFDAAGNLFVANFGGFNVLKIAPDKTVATMADGLAGQPVYLDVTTDGQLYVSLTNELYGRMAVIRVRPDGYAETLFDAPIWHDYRGVLVRNGKVYFVNEGQNTLQELQVTPLATTSLDAFRAEGTRAANYFLGNYKDNSTDNVIQAMRMIGLAEAHRFVTDTTVLANIETAITYEASLLRSLQRADGGWGRTRTGASDPLVSAMVGIALDRTNPSSSDPQVRKLIQYLLNTQAADGSWYNVNNGLTTRLAATSFVLAYLPKALDRLGGIDIDLHVVAPANVTLVNISPVPTAAIPTADGGQEYIWQFLGVTASGRRIDADFTLQNLAPNETRAVAQRAYLEFANSFTGEKLQTDLVVPTVHAQSSLGLGVSLGKTNYQANENLTIASTVTNTGPTVTSGEVRLDIRALGASTTLAEFAPVPVTNLAAGTQFSFATAWNTGTILTGAYEVHGRLFDAQGRFVSESVAPFNIGAPASSVGIQLSTNKPVYNAWDTVDILALVQNTAANAILAPTRAEITVTTPSGATLYSATRPVGQIAPGGIVMLTLNLPLSDAATGNYPVNLVLKDEFTRTVLTTASTSFQVQRQALQGVTGTVTVSTAQVYQGDPIQCTDTAKNISGSDLTGAILTHQLVNMDLGTVVSQFSQTVALPAGGTSSYQKNIDTQGLAVGGYTCVLKAEVSGAVRTLAFAGFKVLEPPIKIDAELKTGAKGRLLVLLDNATVCNDDNGKTTPCKVVDTDTYGPDSAPALSAQRVFLEKVLKAEGWSYTLTETADDFTRAFHSGGYTVYALFNEQEKLAETVQKELREAVFRGEGLLVAGIHDNRPQKLAPALGVRYIGHVSAAAGVSLPQGALNLSGSFNLLNDDPPLRVKRTTAEALAAYTLGAVPAANPDPRDCRDADVPASNVDECDGHPESYLDAVTLNHYGWGLAAYAGFDLLATATRDGDTELTTKLLKALLTGVHPKTINLLPGAGVPIDLTLTNRGMATPAQVTLTLPAGVTVLDPGTGTAAPATGTQPGTVVWQVSLGLQDTQTLHLWLKLPEAPGTVTLSAKVEVTRSGVTKSYAEPSMTLTVPTVPTLHQLKTEAHNLYLTSPADRTRLDQVLAKLDAALRDAKLAKAIEDALKATDALDGASNTNTALNALRWKIDVWLRDAAMRAY